MCLTSASGQARIVCLRALSPSRDNYDNSDFSVDLAASLVAGARYYFKPKFAVYSELSYGISWLTVGLTVKIASPAGYQVAEGILQKAKELAEKSGSRIILTENPKIAIKDADVVYTDVWTSMGQEAESAKRKKVFAGYKIDSKMLKLAKKDAIVMHPLPAHYGEEIEAEIINGPQSVVFDEAENRLHVQKAVLIKLLTGK